jgi:hypothetical protein
MRKKAIFYASLILFTIVFIFLGLYIQNTPNTFVTSVNAQEVNKSTSEPDIANEAATEEVSATTEYDEKYQEYTQKVEEYKRTHDIYRVTRAQYIRSKTQKAKTDAKESTIKLLELRDDVVISYLNVLKAKLNETEGVGDARYEGLAFKIDEEIFWYKRHRDLVSSAGSLEDLVDDSDEAKERQKITERLYYEILSNISHGKVTNYKERVRENLEILREKVDEIRVDERVGFSFSNRKMQVLDRWIFESENLILRTQDKQEQADDMISDMIRNKFQINKIKPYNDVMETLSEGKQFLKEASSYLVEVIKEIKIAEY